jgi:homoserine dehydrogenase
VADIIDTILGRAAITFRTLQLWSDRQEPGVPVRDPARVVGRYYLRLNVEDRPGVLADIAGILGRQSISIASVIQHETEEGANGAVPLVIMTHTATEGAMATAMNTINEHPAVRPGSVRMRVRD